MKSRPRQLQAGLVLEHIRHRFGENEVIADLSLAVHQGELCCLLGPSGCGKTTTLKIIAGLLGPEKGQIWLSGQNITYLPPQKRNVGMVFQNYALFPHMNVFDNVAYGLYRRGMSGEKIRYRVTEALALVRLPGYEAHRIHALSGGEQQRVALARSLVTEPSLLLLDEPLSNLDARLRAEMREEIRRIQRALGTTTIYVTHDQEEAMSIADRIMVMRKGLIEQAGSPREIYEKPATLFVADFIGRINRLGGRISNGKLFLMGKPIPIPPGRWPGVTYLTCAIRPERLRITRADPVLPAVVIRQATYLGAVVRYQATFDDGDGKNSELSIEVPSPEAVYQSGETVAINFNFEDLIFFPRH